MRGTRFYSIFNLRRSRFIPAWAGNTSYCGYGSPPVPVHPRVGGEHRCSGGYVRLPFGSSPRVRGTHQPFIFAILASGFIPAFAGNTGLIQSPSQSGSVHPRVCGEHDGRAHGFCVFRGSSPRVRGTRSTKERSKRKSGSSPRVRGTRLAITRRSYARRFIPACAGNTMPCTID